MLEKPKTEKYVVSFQKPIANFLQYFNINYYGFNSINYDIFHMCTKIIFEVGVDQLFGPPNTVFITSSV